MFKWESFFKKREILEFAIMKEESFDIKKREISLICESTPYFKNMAAESSSLPLKVGEFTCMIESLVIIEKFVALLLKNVLKTNFRILYSRNKNFCSI
jgi:hypothetical protein